MLKRTSFTEMGTEMKRKDTFKEKYKNILRLSAYVWKFKGTFFATIFCGVAKQVFLLMTLLLGALLVGKAFVGSQPAAILKYFPHLICLCLAQGLFTYLHMLITHILAYKILENTRRDLYDSVEGACPLNSLEFQSGDLSTIIMEDVEALEIFFAHVMGDYIIAFISTLVFFLIFAKFSLQYALISLFCALLIALVPSSFSNTKGKIANSLRKRRGDNNAMALDIIQGLREILIFNREKKYIRRLEKDTLSLNRLEIKDGFYTGLQNMLINLLVSGFAISFIIMAHKLYLGGNLDRVYISVFIVMVLNIFIPVLGVSSTAFSLNSVLASANRICRILDQKSPLGETGKSPASLDDKAVFSIRNLCFSYKKGEPVLDGISFDINEGEDIAIVGPSGEGKSTLINLLLRFYDPDKGDIYFRGKNLKSMEGEEIRGQVALVAQDCRLFSWTLLDNLRLGRPDASEEEVKEAAESALAADFIEKLPKGYYSETAEGGFSFSGGERQRLGICRALVKNSKVLIMDEAVSNLDAENEQKLHRALKQIKKGRTFITVAHRLSTILEADRVIELSKGKIVFDGTGRDWSLMRD